MGMDPAENEIWTHFDGVENRLTTVLKKSKPLVGKKIKILIQLFYCLVVASIYL
jgi:tetrahydromethanopterin S-methyltransferase subunit G